MSDRAPVPAICEALEDRRMLAATPTSNGLRGVPISLVDSTTAPSSSLSASQKHAKHVKHQSHVATALHARHVKHEKHDKHVATLARAKHVKHMKHLAHQRHVDHVEFINQTNWYTNTKPGVATATLKAQGTRGSADDLLS